MTTRPTASRPRRDARDTSPIGVSDAVWWCRERSHWATELAFSRAVRALTRFRAEGEIPIGMGNPAAAQGAPELLRELEEAQDRGDEQESQTIRRV